LLSNSVKVVYDFYISSIDHSRILQHRIRISTRVHTIIVKAYTDLIRAAWAKHTRHRPWGILPHNFGMFLRFAVDLAILRLATNMFQVFSEI
jgi:hypothetical protein